MVTLDTLPTELILAIGGLLNRRDLASLIRVSRSCCRSLTEQLYDLKGRHVAVRWAIDNGSCLVLKTALLYCPDTDARDTLINTPMPDTASWDRWATPLARASYGGHIDVVSCLLDHGAVQSPVSFRLCSCVNLQRMFRGFDPETALNDNIPDEELHEIPPWYPLHYAICSKNEEVALLLINRGAPLLACGGHLRITALQSAVANGCLKVVQRLAKRYRELIQGPVLTAPHEAEVDCPPDPRATDAHLYTAMHYLTLCSRPEYVRDICLYLMDLGVPLNTPWGSMAMSPLLMACAMGNFNVATTFVQLGADLRRRDPTPQGHPQQEEEAVLQEHRQRNAAYVYAALGVKYRSAKQRGVAGRSGGKAQWELERQNFIRVFIQHNGKVNEPVAQAGDTPLARAADRGLVPEIRMLVSEGGAVVDRPDAFQITPLCKAAMRGGVAAVEALLEAGADPNVSLRMGQSTTLQIISGMISLPGYEVIIKSLLRYGTRVGRLGQRYPNNYDQTHLISLINRILERVDCTETLILDTILAHSTETNISRGCWQYAAEVALRLNKKGDSKKPGHAGICSLLGIFGTKVGYTFDDSRLCSIVKQLVKRGHPENISCLWLLGRRTYRPRAISPPLKIVHTLSGTFTPAAMLAFTLAFSDKSALPMVTQLLADNDIGVTGRIECLSTKPTLLHLACVNGDWGSAGLLIARGCSATAVNGCLLTPLAEAAAGGYRKLVEAMMDCTSADPHKSYRILSETTALLQAQMATQGDFLRPPPGTKLSQFVVSELIKLQGPPLGDPEPDTSNQHSNDPSLGKQSARNRHTTHLYGFSALEAACHEGHADVVKAILKRYPFGHPIVQAQPGFMHVKPSFSCLTDAALNGHWDVMHVLLRHGADPNQGILHDCLDLTPFHICVDALVHTVRLYNVQSETLLAEQQRQPPGGHFNNQPPDLYHPKVLMIDKRIQHIASVIAHLKSKGMREEPSDNAAFRAVHKLEGEPIPHKPMELLRKLMNPEEEGYMGGRFMEHHAASVTSKFRLAEKGTGIVLVVEEKKKEEEAKKRKDEGDGKPKKKKKKKGHSGSDGQSSLSGQETGLPSSTRGGYTKSPPPTPGLFAPSPGPGSSSRTRGTTPGARPSPSPDTRPRRTSLIAQLQTRRSSGLLGFAGKSLAILLLLFFLSTGAYGGMITGFGNGFFAALTKIKTGHPSEVVGYEAKREFTGVEAVDKVLLTLVTFFAAWLDAGDPVEELGSGPWMVGSKRGGRTWDVDVPLWAAMVQFAGAWALVSLEGARRGNKGRVVGWTVFWGMGMQLVSYTIAGPIYFIISLLTSPVASGSDVDALAVNEGEMTVLPVCVTMAFLVPAFMMGLPSPRVIPQPEHQNWMATWQVFPILQANLMFFLKGLFGSASSASSEGNSAKVTMPLARKPVGASPVYKFTMGLCVVAQMGFLVIALTPPTALPADLAASYPWLSAMLKEVDIGSAIPRALWDPPYIDVSSLEKIRMAWLAPLAKHFLQWDVYSGNSGLLTWAAYQYWAAGVGGGKRFVKALTWLVLGGPVAMAAYLLWERDEAAIERDDDRGRRRSR
ncbi:hypothetical protein B0T20DRAFT_373917 [Sordaria brevicollis]|uniref:Ankyrin n=1 Tax=Sordaria brevicollis TaxID=83679 RepID=A0AAE0UEC2_SORBR|nr:hypothetical protein B0T20DRAFT_373917 [Sordaria brevicollis]